MLSKYAFVKVELHDFSEIVDLTRQYHPEVIIVDRPQTSFKFFSMKISFTTQEDSEDEEDFSDSDDGYAYSGKGDSHAVEEIVQHHSEDTYPYVILIGDEQIVDFCRTVATLDTEEYFFMTAVREHKLAIEFSSVQGQTTAQSQSIRERLRKLVASRWWGFSDVVVTVGGTKAGVDCVEDNDAFCAQAVSSLTRNKWSSHTDMIEELNMLIHIEAKAFDEQKKHEQALFTCDMVQFLVGATMLTAQGSHFATITGFRESIIKIKFEMFYTSSRAAWQLSSQHYKAAGRDLQGKGKGQSQPLSEQSNLNASLSGHYAQMTIDHAEEGFNMVESAKEDGFELDAKKRAHMYFFQAMVLITLGRFDEAEAKAALSITTSPDDENSPDSTYVMGEMKRMMRIMRGWGPALMSAPR